MSACVLDVEVTPKAGSPGSRVALRVRPSDQVAVSGVRVSIVGYGFEQALDRSGGEWTTQAMVPYEAEPGEYLLDVYALDAQGNRLGTARGSFTVTV